jgi:hypothetical protein
MQVQGREGGTSATKLQKQAPVYVVIGRHRDPFEGECKSLSGYIATL